MQNAEERATTQTTLHNMFLVKGGYDEMQHKKQNFLQDAHYIHPLNTICSLIYNKMPTLDYHFKGHRRQQKKHWEL